LSQTLNPANFATARRSSQPVDSKAHRRSSYVDHTCDGRRAWLGRHLSRVLFATRPSIVTQNSARGRKWRVMCWEPSEQGQQGQRLLAQLQTTSDAPGSVCINCRKVVTQSTTFQLTSSFARVHLRQLIAVLRTGMYTVIVSVAQSTAQGLYAYNGQRRVGWIGWAELIWQICYI